MNQWVTKKIKEKRKGRIKAKEEGRSGYATLKAYPVDSILPLIVEKDRTKRYKTVRVNLEGFKVKISTTRLRLFKKFLKCVECGLEGSIFLLQRGMGEKKRYEMPHLNLYGRNLNGILTLMTKDHIVPKSKGGHGSLSNLQTMCALCNCKKGDS